MEVTQKMSIVYSCTLWFFIKKGIISLRHLVLSSSLTSLLSSHVFLWHIRHTIRLWTIMSASNSHVKWDSSENLTHQTWFSFELSRCSSIGSSIKISLISILSTLDSQFDFSYRKLILSHTMRGNNIEVRL